MAVKYSFTLVAKRKFKLFDNKEIYVNNFLTVAYKYTFAWYFSVIHDFILNILI